MTHEGELKMLLIERQVRQQFILDASVKMPRKGNKLFLSSPFYPSGVVVYWTDRKSPEGKRLFNCGAYRPDGSEPPLFTV
jgi:hypothetical protein